MLPHVIRVEDLGKRYRIGAREQKADSLIGAALRQLASPVTNLRKLRQLRSFDESDAEDVIWAIRNVSFRVASGEAVGIIGRNGAGKSTLLKLLSRITAPTTGRITLNGRVASLLEVGTGFHPELTGRENVYLNGTLLGMRKAEVDRKFDEIAAFSGIEKFLDTPVKRYSSGMRVRLGFSVAAHLDPEILLIDEVLAVGDAGFQKRCLGKMEEVTRSGRTILFVSHNMAAVQALCRRAILIDGGTIAAEGSSDEMVAEYLKRSAGDEGTELLKHARRGDGPLRFARWEVRDDVLGVGTRIRANTACSFLIEYRSPEPLTNLEMAVTIKDSLHQPVLTGSTTFQSQPLPKLPTSGVLRCHFEQLPLIPGSYRIHLWAQVNGVMSDLIEDAGGLDVLPADAYGTGRLPERKHGVVLAAHHWHFEGPVCADMDPAQKQDLTGDRR